MAFHPSNSPKKKFHYYLQKYSLDEKAAKKNDIR